MLTYRGRMLEDKAKGFRPAAVSLTTILKSACCTGDIMGVKGLDWWEQKLNDIDADDGPKGRADHPPASAARKRKRWKTSVTQRPRP